MLTSAAPRAELREMLLEDEEEVRTEVKELVLVMEEEEGGFER